MNWQDYLSIAITLLALLFLAWRFIQFAKAKKDCQSCTGCSAKEPNPVSLHQINMPSRNVIKSN